MKTYEEKYISFIKEWKKEQKENGITNPKLDNFPRSSLAWATWKSYKNHIKNIKKTYKNNPESAKKRTKEWRKEHPIISKRYNKKYKQDNHEYYINYLKDYRENPKTRPKLLRNKRKYYEDNFDKISKKRKKDYKNNSESIIQRVKKYYERTKEPIKLEVLTHYSDLKKPRCRCCNEKIIDFLTIEHPNGRNEEIRRTGGNFYRWIKAQEFPRRLHVLCFNCNCSKGFYGICSHKKQYEYPNDYTGRNKKQVFEYYSKGKPKCDCCNESNIGLLSVDHIKNIGRKRKGQKIYSWLINNNFPNGFRILCFNCNSGRNLRRDKKCPHELLR